MPGASGCRHAAVRHCAARVAARKLRYHVHDKPRGRAETAPDPGRPLATDIVTCCELRFASGIRRGGSRRSNILTLRKSGRLRGR